MKSEEIRNPIQVKIEQFEKHIGAYHHSLGMEGIWLFLATLGCWSVNEHMIQILALLISIGLFGFRVDMKREDSRSFPEIEKKLEV